jgi:hypothetical protein
VRRRSRPTRGTVIVTTAQAAVIRQALADAEAYRRERAEAYCHDCQRHPTGACEDHLNDLDAADAYRDLVAELGRVLPRSEHGAAPDQLARTPLSGARQLGGPR